MRWVFEYLKHVASVSLLVQIKFLSFDGIFLTCQVSGFMSGHGRVPDYNTLSLTDVRCGLHVTTPVAMIVASKFN